MTDTRQEDTSPLQHSRVSIPRPDRFVLIHKKGIAKLALTGALIGGGLGIAKSCEGNPEKPVLAPIEQTTAPTQPTQLPKTETSTRPMSPPTTEQRTQQTKPPENKPKGNREQVAESIVEFYDTKSQVAGQSLMTNINEMNFNDHQDGTADACVQYEQSSIDYPTYNKYPGGNTFSLTFNGNQWLTKAMGDVCTVDQNTSFTPKDAPPLPVESNVKTMIKNAFDNADLEGERQGTGDGYVDVLESINSIDVQESVGDYKRACVEFEYSYSDYITGESYAADVRPDSNGFVFHFNRQKAAWETIFIRREGC